MKFKFSTFENRLYNFYFLEIPFSATFVNELAPFKCVLSVAFDDEPASVLFKFLSETFVNFQQNTKYVVFTCVTVYQLPYYVNVEFAFKMAYLYKKRIIYSSKPSLYKIDYTFNNVITKILYQRGLTHDEAYTFATVVKDMLTEILIKNPIHALKEHQSIVVDEELYQKLMSSLKEFVKPIIDKMNHFIDFTSNTLRLDNIINFIQNELNIVAVKNAFTYSNLEHVSPDTIFHNYQINKHQAAIDSVKHTVIESDNEINTNAVILKKSEILATLPYNLELETYDDDDGNDDDDDDDPVMRVYNSACRKMTKLQADFNGTQLLYDNKLEFIFPYKRKFMIYNDNEKQCFVLFSGIPLVKINNLISSFIVNQFIRIGENDWILVMPNQNCPTLNKYIKGVDEKIMQGMPTVLSIFQKNVELNKWFIVDASELKEKRENITLMYVVLERRVLNEIIANINCITFMIMHSVKYKNIFEYFYIKMWMSYTEFENLLLNVFDKWIDKRWKLLDKCNIIDVIWFNRPPIQILYCSRFEYFADNKDLYLTNCLNYILIDKYNKILPIPETADEENEIIAKYLSFCEHFETEGHKNPTNSVIKEDMGKLCSICFARGITTVANNEDTKSYEIKCTAPSVLCNVFLEKKNYSFENKFYE